MKWLVILVGLLTLSGCGESETVPAGAVLAFNVDSCPKGWSEFKDGRGRVIVGVNPSVPGIDGTKGENGLSARKRGDKDTGAETVTLSAANVPPHKHDTTNIETMQVQAHFEGYPALTVPGRDPNTTYTSPVVGEGANTPEPLNNLPPFSVLLFCQKD